MLVEINTVTTGIIEGIVEMNLAELNATVAEGSGVIRLTHRGKHRAYVKDRGSVEYDVHYDIAARHVVWVRTMTEVPDE